MAKLSSCPVGYTCPDIDGVIEVIKKCEERLNALGDIPAKDIVHEADDIAAELYGLYDGKRSPLEEIRSANEQLRSWGEGLEQGVTELEADIKSLSEELEAARDEIREAI